MFIGGLQKCSTIDFPGRIACVIFTQGCGLDCFYCHNRALIQKSCDALYDMDLVWDFLNKRAGMLEGVVLSGGEPTVQDELFDDIRRIHELGYDIKLDTNGQRIEKLRQLVENNMLDYVAVDLKASSEMCGIVCGSANAFERAADCIEYLAQSDATYEVRTTLYPGMKIDELIEIMSAIPKAPLYRLNYFRMPSVVDIKRSMELKKHALTKGEIVEKIEMLKQIQPNIVI